MTSFTIKIGGEAGQGLVSVGNILLETIARAGWYIFAHQDYDSRVRGGHNFFQIRISDEPVYTWESKVDLLVALDQETILQHSEELKNAGFAIYDPDTMAQGEGKNYLPISYAKVVAELGLPKVMANAVAAGAIWAFLSDDIAPLCNILREMFSDKGEDIAKGNCMVAEAGFKRVAQVLGNQSKPPRPQHVPVRMLVKGNDALPMGALAAGLKFMSAYPMTPSTGVTEFIAKYGSECSVLMEQAEDEISAINMTIGAAYTGVRAMTATSGGGFALMTEAIGLAGSAEIPVVIINAQRPGPSTGLPTRTEQGDLLFAVSASSGDFPRAILAPGDAEEAFDLMGHAFNLAEEYQMPVIVLSDQHLADSHVTIPPLDVKRIERRRGVVAAGSEAGKDYRRYRLTESGISPRLYPGFGPGLVVSAGDEHDEQGHLIEDAETRIKMMEKRMTKLKAVARRALAPVIFGAKDNPKAVLISWGSTKGALRETVELLNKGGCRVQGVHLPQVFPLPAELEEILRGPGRKVIVEGNYSGQLQRLIASEFAWKPDASIRRYDGRPLNPDYILSKLRGGAACGS